jgi:hypothetical protein
VVAGWKECPGGERSPRIIRCRRLGAYHAGAGRDGARGERGSAEESSPAERRHDHVQIGYLVQNFKRAGPLTGDDAQVVRRVHKLRPGLIHDVLEGTFPVIRIIA